MDRVVEVVLSLAGGLVLLWLGAVASLYVLARREQQPVLREALRLLPDVLRLVRRLAADHSVGTSRRVLLWLLLGYLLLPVDLVPDFLPVVGYADDVLLVAWVLRSVVRAVGDDALAAHWPGTPTGLRALRRLLRLPGG